MSNLDRDPLLKWIVENRPYLALMGFLILLSILARWIG